jgi:hypothetical protein
MIIVFYIYIYLLVYEISPYYKLAIGVLDRAFGYESRELEFDSRSRCLFFPKIGKKKVQITFIFGRPMDIHV